MDKKDPNKSFNINKEEKELLVNGLNGHGWCCKHWGTKWGICEGNVDSEGVDRGNINYCFDTAWSPPIPLIKKMGELFPDLMFSLEYSEPGMNYEGRFVMEKGKVTEYEEKDMEERTSQ